MSAYDSDGKVSLSEWLCYPLSSVWYSVKAAPLSSVCAFSVITLVYTAVVALMVMLFAMRSSLQSEQASLVMSVYLRDEVQPEEVEKVMQHFRGAGEVEQVVYRSKDDALDLFRTALDDLRYVTEGLENDNPLPASIEVQFGSDHANVATFERYRDKVNELQGVEVVHYPGMALGMLGTLLQGLRTLFQVLLSLLMCSVGFIVWLTLSLGMYAHRREIEIKKLLGASPWYMWSPCVVEGALLGAGGAVGGVFIMAGLHKGARWYSLQGQGPLWEYGVSLRFLPVSLSLLVIATGLLVGIIGSYFAARRWMRV